MKNGEGMWLVFGLMEDDCWVFDKEVDYLFVKVMWFRKF